MESSANQEELELDLNQEEASSLYLLIQTGIDALAQKEKILASIKELPTDKRPTELKEDETIDGVIRLNHQLQLDGGKLLKAVGQIVVELEKSNNRPKPIIIPSPTWKP